MAGAVYVEDAAMRITGAISFVNNSAAFAGGALIGSPRSVIDIRSEQLVFSDNTAVTV
jgi:predicted outer membrane repeat protein